MGRHGQGDRNGLHLLQPRRQVSQCRAARPLDIRRHRVQLRSVRPRAIVSTIRLENFADGLEDYAYAKMLEKRLSENPGKTPGWTEKAKALIAVPSRVVESVWSFSNDPQAIYGWRDAMADMIESE